MARQSEVEEGRGKHPHGRRDYIDALLHHRRPPPVDDIQLLKRIESKTAQHRSPFSANISRKHASILSAISPPGRTAPKLGHKRNLTPTREASRRKAFEVFEWDRDFEPIEPEGARKHDGPAREDTWATPPEPRPALTKYLASLQPEELGEEEVGQEPAEETPPELAGEEPGMVPEAEDIIDEGILEEAEALIAARPAEEPAGEDTIEEAQEPGPEVVEAPPEVVVEGRPGHPTREGGEFPTHLMEPLDDTGPEATAQPDIPKRGEEDEAPALTLEHVMDLSDDEEVETGETETAESVVGLAHAHRWPSDTGLEIHIDGFEHISATSDLCPRCGRRITARNRLLTCSDCGAVACESCEIKTTASVDSPYYYDWRFELPLCVNCYEKAFSIQTMLAKAKAALGMGNHTYAFYHAQQALRTDPGSPYAEDAQRIISQVDKRRRESAEQDEAWKRQRAMMSRTTVVRDEE